MPHWLPQMKRVNLLDTIITKEFFCDVIHTKPECHLALLLSEIVVWLLVCYILLRIGYFWKI